MSSMFGEAMLFCLPQQVTLVFAHFIFAWKHLSPFLVQSVDN